jgi:hypothetical protein
MRVALCFFGQPRLLENPYTYNSHLKHIIDKYPTDVYVHNWIGSENTPFTYSDWALDKMQEDWKQVQSQNVKGKVEEMYSPIAAKFDTARTFRLSNESREIVKTLPFYSTNNENNTLSQLYSISECLKLVKCIDYDFIILSRYDNYIYSLPDLTELSTDNFYVTNRYQHFADVLFIGGVDAVRSLICFDKIEQMCNKIPMFIPEEFKRIALYENQYKETRVGIDVGIARTLTTDHIQK